MACEMSALKTGGKVSRGEEPSYRVCEVTEFARLTTEELYGVQNECIEKASALKNRECINISRQY